MTLEAHHRRLEQMYHGAPTNAYYRPRLAVGPRTATVTIEVREEFFHPLGAVHGSVYFKALDDAAFFAASAQVTDAFLLTVSFTVHLLRPVSTGVLTAVGTLVHASKRVLVAEADLVDSDGRPLARGSGTFMRSSVPLSEELGYR